MHIQQVQPYLDPQIPQILFKNWENYFNLTPQSSPLSPTQIHKHICHYLILCKHRKTKRPCSLPPTPTSIKIPFDQSKFNFCKISKQEILMEGKWEGHMFRIIVNATPICYLHSLIVVDWENRDVQLLNQGCIGVLLHLLDIFPAIKIGYNSIGAAASVNHLHFHLLYSEYLIQSSSMPIQTYPRQQWMTVHPPIPNSTPIQISQISTNGTTALVLSPSHSLSSSPSPSSCPSLSTIFNLILVPLLQLGLPHNLLVSGHTVYIVVRQFSSEGYGWVEFAGVGVVYDEHEMGKGEQQVIQVKNKLSVPKQVLDELKTRIYQIMLPYL